jgi:hypothetical protein
MKNIIFQIDGGIGKSIMGTAICEIIKKKYPEDRLIVITAYPEVFIGNPHVHKCYTHNNLQYFYSDNIEGKEVITFLHNPYLETNYITRKEHLLETWCSMFDLEYSGESPQLYFSKREGEFYSRTYTSDKPIMVIQTNGGAADQQIKYSWMRDIPINIAQQIVDYFAHEYSVFHIRREDQLPLGNTIPVHADFRSLVALISLSTKRLFIDSFAQHVAKTLDLNSVVCWIGNTPTQFGYDNNINIVANSETRKPELKNAVFSKYNISGEPMEFPYNDESEIFNVEEIIQAVENI